MPQAAFGAKADARAWYGNQPFNTSPILLHLPAGPGLRNGSTAAQEYLGFIWYHLQLLLNDGNGGEYDHNPIDHPYVQGVVKGLSDNGNNTPEAMLLLEWLIKALQEETQPGKGPEFNNFGFQPTATQAVTLVHQIWDIVWTGVPAATRATTTQAFIQAWFAQVSSYSVAQYYAGKDGNGRPWASPTEDPSTSDSLSTFGGEIWYMLPRPALSASTPT